MEIGQADGIACRSMEMFEAFGIADRIRPEAYHVNEVSFWQSDPQTHHLVRSDRINDVEDDLSEMPHVILSQARVHDFLLERLRNAATPIVPAYQTSLISLSRPTDPMALISAVVENTSTGVRQTIRARYVVGCDGAHSVVRREMGLALEGASARQLWGVMDVLVDTDFPDIRLKSVVRSHENGALLIIPREGGYLVRTYLEMGQLADGERAADRPLDASLLIAKAKSILSPYLFEVKEVAWWSAYEIGQRLSPQFDDSLPKRQGAHPAIFIAGDACHTHSPKAGQGMNVSMADAFNLGWKLAAVIQGRARPELLLSYSNERHAKAQELLDFDRDMARYIGTSDDGAETRTRFQEYFQKHARFSAGVETQYAPSLIVQDPSHQGLATGQIIGKRFHSAPVIRVADAHPMQLGHAHEADGRWRLFAFGGAGDWGTRGASLAQLCIFLEQDPNSPLRRYTKAGEDRDSVFDLRAVMQAPHRAIEVPELPELLRPRKGRYGLRDHEKVFVPTPDADIYTRRGIDRTRGALIVVRPDQYVADVLPLEAHKRLATFFDGFMLKV